MSRRRIADGAPFGIGHGAHRVLPHDPAASPEAVAERESLLTWQAPPAAEARHWRLRLEGTEARLLARA